MVWSLPRTSHWTATALEDAGFEIREKHYHIYGSGFPKSHNISKAIDKYKPREGMFDQFANHLKQQRKKTGMSTNDVGRLFPSKTGGVTGCCSNWEHSANVPTLDQWKVLQPLLELSFEFLPLIERVEAEREILETRKDAGSRQVAILSDKGPSEYNITAPATPEAQRWDGFGTATKPAVEEWILVRKPFKGAVAPNVLKHGTGALNIQACRVKYNEKCKIMQPQSKESLHNPKLQQGGRWPAHLVLSHHPDCVLQGEEEVAADWICHAQCPVKILGDQSGVSVSTGAPITGASNKQGYAQGISNRVKGGSGGAFKQSIKKVPQPKDKGTAARYFQQFEPEYTAPFLYCPKPSTKEKNAGLEGKNRHPTIKPTKLMRYFAKLITPPGGTILDCFMGSGTTGVSAVQEGFNFIGVELEEPSFRTAQARIRHACNQAGVEVPSCLQDQSNPIQAIVTAFQNELAQILLRWKP